MVAFVGVIVDWNTNTFFGIMTWYGLGAIDDDVKLFPILFIGPNTTHKQVFNDFIHIFAGFWHG
jgi:hypothetical protein